MYWLWTLALAAPPEVTRLPARPLAMAMVELAAPTLLVLDGERLLALEGTDIVASRPTGGTDMLVDDLDGDGRAEVLLCRGDGVAAVPLAPRSIGTPIALGTPPCERILSIRGDDGSVEVVFTGAQGPHRLVSTADGMGVEAEPIDAAPTVPDGPAMVTADLDDDGCPDTLRAVEEGFVSEAGRCDDVAATQPPPPSDEPIAAPPDDAEVPAEAPTDDVPVADDSWPPAQWTRGPRTPAGKLPEPPDTLVLTADSHPTVQAFVGQSVRMHLSPPAGRIEKVDGGPPGARLEGGAFVLDTDGWDIGRWGVSVRAEPGQWYSFDVEVWPRPAEGQPLPPPPAALAATTTALTGEPVEERWYHIDRCAVGAGVAGGVSRSGGLVWEDLGSPEVQRSGSPAVAVVCTGGGVVSWVLGLDAAPWFRYTDLPADRSHLIGATAGLQVGTDRFGVGPYGSAGVTAVNVGLRGQGFVTDRFGAEVRAGWLAPLAGVEAMALFLVRTGR